MRTQLKTILSARKTGSLAFAAAAMLFAASAFRAQAPAAAAAQVQSQVPQSQIDAGGMMTFDVASIKHNQASEPAYCTPNFPWGGAAYGPNGGLFSAKNCQVRGYIGFAYKLTPYQTRALDASLPKWAKDEHFDIEARAAANTTKDQMRLMMRNLLAGRFKLAIHAQTRQGPILALVPVKPGETGPKLRPHSDDLGPCGAFTTSASARLPGGIPSSCEVFLTLLDGGRTQTSARNVSLEMIAATFPFGGMPSFDRPVVDRTGLSGLYDFTIEYVPETAAAPGAQDAETGPSYLEALRDQLGLKLESTTGAIDTLVIDHIEEPTPN